MSEILTNIVTSQKDILSVLRKRRKEYIEKSVSASNLELAGKKAALEEEGGWRILRKGKRRSIRLAKDKLFDEKLEDEVWCILADMGFKELSKDRFFKIPVGPSIPDRQIDIFAKDDETVLLIECTACEERKKKSLSDLIEKIDNVRKYVLDLIKLHYKMGPKLKMKWGIATRNIEWSQNDVNKCEEKNIFILKDEQIDYFRKVTDHIHLAAKYQLLAYIFKDEEIPGINLVVAATRGKMGGKTFYNFLMRPYELLKIAYISHKKGTSLEDFESYQRMLEPKRLKKIGQYIDKGGQFPTNIVVNIKSKRGVHFDKKEDIADSSFGQLTLPSTFASAWIIDGQHRLYGYAYSKRAQNDSEDKTSFPVLAYINLPTKDEAEMFIDINSEQVKVKRNLLNELYANLKWDSEKFSERIDGLCARAGSILNSSISSPLYDRIIITGRHKTKYRCLTLTSFVDGLQENKFFGEEKKSGITPGPFTASYSGDLYVTLEKAISILDYYLSLFKNSLPTHWALGDSPGGFLCTNHGIRALLGVLGEILKHIEYLDSLECHSLKAENLYDNLEIYSLPIINSFKQYSKEDISIFRDESALKGVRRNINRFLYIIYKNYPQFHPLRLAKYQEEISEEGTKVAKDLIDDIEKKLYNFIIPRLKEYYIEKNDKWWYEGIPETIRGECAKKKEEDKGLKEVQQYIYLIDYHSILKYNWEKLDLEKYYAFTKEGGKEKKLEWIKKLNNIRKITHHPSKWPVEECDVNTVREIYKNLIERIG